MIRMILFLLTNLSVMLIFSIILSLTGIQSHTVYGLLIMSSLFGFSGSILSLILSKWIALRSVDGKIITHPKNETENWLIDTIREQSIKKGIIMPQIAIYHAADINAFATGARRNSALIAISTGLLENMTRNEAEAVIAHEISHIANGDMITMTLIQGVVNTFVIFISRILSQIISSVVSNNRNENNVEEKNPFVYFLISTFLELIFGVLASMITMWFSRHREFYADASSAKLVGREKMISALNRLKTSHEPQESDSMIAFCINGKSNNYFLKLFASHPSLDKRIQALYNREYM
ncbi:protease HtpX [Buchnera aphidicola]|uniref:Protease HtpX n=1 Tax=Buchnera aphidicola str. USDA (Myzus persicae) TaxID=1009856 RepID=W0P3N7_BUCMP|nr:protease HtpX [Buchnera aphidicola]AHG60062.1 Htpx [Buchnera aphidicola str. USDA (Myzus persicae)]AHG60642.1 Htpx [Buchnera aphidicola str. W106 (Myzus persicae)]AHG61214.1 Htpx [Buchnera aphidicola str. G002 (Myzus persicae)]AHG61787.1 Htpx [Buchnera aphidicola str. F009 (Myzus persicae)]WAI03253.1 MAG: protease HtpX [Buchnera aphidicola (Myzus persicae)]